MDARFARLGGALFAVAAISACSAPAATAVPAAGITGLTTLVTVDTSTPADVRSRPIAGLETASETAIGLDTRPATGELFVVTVPDGVVGSALIRTYKVDPVTATATFVGSVPGAVSGAGDYPTGADFQPLVDRIRVVNSTNENFRLNPNTGALAGDDVNLTVGPPATGPVTALAYDRNVAPGPPGTVAPPGSRTTLYGIDVGADRLVVQGGIDGAAPGGPNGGTISDIGPLGVPVTNSSDAGFDIAPDGTAYASLRNGIVSTLYRLNLSTGAATAIGTLGTELRALTVLAPDNCPLLSGDDQADLDGDGQGDACDPDIDGDGLTNAAEAARGTDARRVDTDGDGVVDGLDACATAAGSIAKNGCDGSAPAIVLTRTPRHMTRKRFFAGVKPRIAVSEAAALDVVLLGRARSARVARAGDLVLAERHLGLSSSTRSVRLKPKRALASRSTRFSVRLRVTATDAAGNRSTKTKTIRVRG
jgi:Domain of unknown function (DUF4394)/Thrombospondin type 3 repeat